MTTARPLPAALLLAALSGLSVLGGCTDAAPEPAAAAPALRTVRVATVRPGPAEPPVLASGLAASRDEAKLAFKTGGVIAAIEVREGDAIKAGQRLARIEATEVDAGVAQAQAALDKARRDLERGRRLFKDDVVTREQLDDLGTAETLARAQFDAVRYNRRYAEILAPADGRVLARLAEPRELVGPGSPVLIVSAAGSGTVLAVGLADRDALRVAVGDPAEVSFDALPGRRFKARVQELARAADPRTGTWRCELAVDTAGEALPAFSGLIGRARIEPASANAATRSYLPIEALVEGDQARARLYRYDPATGTVQASEQAVAFIAGREVALEAVLPAGSQVVTDGAAFLRDGEQVRIAPNTASAAP
jgi:RND family efflux transporter MFP subunit